MNNTPENQPQPPQQPSNPNQQPGAPELDPVAAQLEAVKNALQVMTVEKVAEAVTSTANAAEELRQENAFSLSKRDKPNYIGDINNPDSSRGQAARVKRAVQTMLLAAQGIGPGVPGVEGAPDPAAQAEMNALTRDLLTKINQHVGVSNITEQTAPYFHEMFHKLLTGQAKSMDDLVPVWNNLATGLGVISPTVQENLRRALLTTAQDRGWAQTQFEDKFLSSQRHDANETNDPNRAEYEKSKIYDTIEKDTVGRDKYQLKEFYSAFETSETFDAFYHKELQRIRENPAEMQKFRDELIKEKPNATQAEQDAFAEKRAKEEVTREMHRKLIYLVNLFFKSIFIASPDKQFNEVMQESTGQYSPNPDNLLKHLTSRISNIKTSLIGSQDPDKSDYMVFGQEKTENYDHVQRTTVFTRVPSKELQEGRFDTFINQLYMIATTERNLIEYGHNFRYATNMGPQGDKGFFNQIAEYAKGRLTSNEIDMVNTVEYSELVQSAKLQLERRYKLAFAKLKWTRDISFLREVFESSHEVDRQIRNSLLYDFGTKYGKGDNQYDDLIIDRCLAHARTLVFGKEFSLHLWSSYADPRLKKAGDPSYSRESLAGAATFSIFDDAKRWNIRNGDLSNDMEILLSVDEDDFDIDDINAEKDRRLKEYGEAYIFGYSAFEKGVPLVFEHGGNISKAGGVDAWGGYRLSWAYDQWMYDLLDGRTLKQELNYKDGPEDVFVQGWKRVENVGVNVLKNYMENFLFTDNQLMTSEERWKGGIDPRVEQRYQKFFGFLYDRYLGEKGSVGNTYVEGKSKEQYVSEMLAHLKPKGGGKPALQSEMYKIMSVALFERTPLEFISMEKPVLTQNGVTLLSEIQDVFHSDPEMKAVDPATNETRKPEKEFDGATDDLTYVEQRARLDSIKDMERIRKDRKMNGDSRNIYGDMNSLRSDVLKDSNGVGGYVVNETYIANILKEKYTDPVELEWRTKRAIKMYSEIRRRLQKAPDRNKEIDVFDGVGDNDDAKAESRKTMKKKLEKVEGEGMKKRMDWWAESWKSYKFGMTFSADTADQFLDRSRTGPDTVSNAAEGCANTAEALKNAWGPTFKSACEEAATSRKFEPIYKHMNDLRSIVKIQDLAIWDNDIAPLMFKRVLNTMSKDNRSLKMWADLRDSISGRTGSISEGYAGQENFQVPWSWDRNDRADFLEGAYGMSSGGLISQDLMRELRKYAQAEFGDLFRHHYLKLSGLAGLALIYFAANGAIEQNKD